MKILHYIPGVFPVRGGGLYRYAFDLALGEKKAGNEVLILLPGKRNRFKKTVIRKQKSYNGLLCYEFTNAMPITEGRGIREIEYLMQYGEKKVYLDFLQENNPELIHVHSVMGLHLAFLEAANNMGIPLVYTTHDYYGLCPKATLMREHILCNERKWDKCIHCMSMVSLKKVYKEQTRLFLFLKSNWVYRKVEYSQCLLPLKRFLKNFLRSRSTACVDEEKEKYEQLRTYYRQMFAQITHFHFNSSQAEKIYRMHLGVLSGKVIPISHAGIYDQRRKRKCSEVLRVGFLGSGQEAKGFYLLKGALYQLYDTGNCNVVCDIYFNMKEKPLPFIKGHEPYTKKNVERVFQKIDLLIMPSEWYETYGFVAMEALSRGVPVLVSDRVGMREVGVEREGIGIVVPPTVQSLAKELERICYDRSILENMNKNICKWNYDFSFEKHVKEMMEWKEMVRDEKKKE